MAKVEGKGKRLLLISNSTLYGNGYLDHAEVKIRRFLDSARRVLFVPYALYDRTAYAAKARARLAAMGYRVESIHEAAVGADSEEKQELDPVLLASNKVVADILEQCATIGDLHHALEKGLLTRADVHAELGEVVAGTKPGRAGRDHHFR